MNKEELIKQGYQKEVFTVHIQEYDPHLHESNENILPFRRFSYDLGYNYDDEHVAQIKAFVNEVNNRFPNIKMCTTGGGWYKSFRDGIKITENEGDKEDIRTLHSGKSEVDTTTAPE